MAAAVRYRSGAGSRQEIFGVSGYIRTAFIPAETIDRVHAAVTEHGAQFETYAGANHAFDNPSPAFHHPQASAAAWQSTTRFLNQHLPT